MLMTQLVVVALAHVSRETHCEAASGDQAGPGLSDMSPQSTDREHQPLNPEPLLSPLSPSVFQVHSVSLEMHSMWCKRADRAKLGSHFRFCSCSELP